jgi:heat shock protein HspQ
MNITQTQFSIGQVVKHRKYPFRGVIIDVDHKFNNTEEWWLSIPEDIRPQKDQPFYHLLAENELTVYVAYVSEQNLLIDDSGKPISHPKVNEIFGEFLGDSYAGHVGTRH